MSTESYFQGYLAREPEEATTLGARGHDDRLKDLSEAGRADDLAFHRAAIAELEADDAAVDRLDRLDRLAMLARSRFVVRAHETLHAHETNTFLSMLPYAALGYQLAHGRPQETIRARAAAIPRYLAVQEENLRAGVARGGAAGPDRTLLAETLEQQLPGAARALDLLGETEAAEAYRRHADVLARDVLPRARDTWAIGEEEYAWRLRTCMAIDEPPASIVARYEDELLRERAAFRACAARLDRTADPARVLAGVAAARPASADDVVPLYRAPLERAARFARERALFDVPEEFDLAFPSVPDGWLPGAHATNWPAPLLDRSARGAFAVTRDAAVHSVAWAANLAIHEGIPGHYLQSLAWQRAFSGDPAPVRFLVVADDIAIARQDFGAMLGIEGWAVWAEETMLEAGFFEGRLEEELCARASRVIRAARVVTDVALHSGRVTPEEAAPRFAEATSMPERFGRGQVLRFMRTPLQSITYALGCDVIRRLRAARDGALLDFHAWLLAHGPVPPTVLA